MAQVNRVTHATAGHQHSQQVGEGVQENRIWGNLKLRNITNFFYWDTEDGLDGLIKPVPGSHHGFATEFPGVIISER